MTASEQIARLGADLVDKQRRANGLALELAASLAIRDVWPEAWDNGCTVKLMARETLRTMREAERDARAGRQPKLSRMWLQRSDGACFELDAVTYWSLKALPRGKAVQS